MLILELKPGATIESDGPCQIVLCHNRKGEVRLGFVAPTTTNIVRSNAKRKEQREARTIWGHMPIGE